MADRTSTVPTNRREADRRPLPATSFAILGLLTFGEMSGYDVGKFAERSVGYFFSPAKSQIYSELRRLVSRGYATERAVEQEGRPDKRLYRITERGREALREWLETGEVEPDELKSPFLLKLFFGAHMSREGLIEQTREIRRRSVQQLAELRDIERLIRGREDMFYPNLTLQCGLVHCRASIRWADQVLAELEREGPHQPEREER